ncbi:MAG TPA: retroviral-like aspartic protease family protein [Phenylobacterium sp.]|uniref:retroviral-like aspartic protease family protein n=1 Tax=Phenylobacterium sp. TaxID=1871053 RepID=UPI002B6CB3DF|nr:retroviral-like aspartic protease family protein [Phenylobacterium sp.]HSV03372.1 retroviral-like aspartic protease family protein [Phenylobacterium sp.]
MGMLLDRRQAGLGLLSAAGAFAPLRAWCQATQPDGPAVIAPADQEPSTQLQTERDPFKHMLAPVTINKQGPFQFLIDTGANVSCVSRDLAERLALPPDRPAPVHTPVGVRIRPTVLIERLDVGARTRRRVRTATFTGLGPGIDGVLGVDWLAGQRLALDFKTRRLEITRSRDEFESRTRVIVPARRRLGQLTIVDADLGGHRISAMIDSGSQATICNKPLRDLVTRMERGRPDGQPHYEVKLETLAGEPFDGEMFYLPFLKFGGLQLGNVPTVYAETDIFELWGLKTTPAVVLGMDLLTQFEAVALDYGRSRVRFDLA